MSSSAPVVRLDEFVARRARKAQGGIGPQRVAVPVGSASPAEDVSTPITRAVPVGRPPRPGLVRACAGRVAPSAPPTARGIGLTRRGRIALAVLVATLVSAVLAGLGGAGPWPAPGAGADPVRSGRTTTVTVRPGQTLWDIASRVSPGADVRATVDEIAELNHLQSAGDVQAGRQLLVPTTASR